MIANIETFFDFKNSKEYISSYSLEKVDDNKIRIKKNDEVTVNFR